MPGENNDDISISSCPRTARTWFTSSTISIDLSAWPCSIRAIFARNSPNELSTKTTNEALRIELPF